MHSFFGVCIARPVFDLFPASDLSQGNLILLVFQMLTEEALTEELEALLDTAREQDSLKRILELSNLQGNCTMLVR